MNNLKLHLATDVKSGSQRKTAMQIEHDQVSFELQRTNQMHGDWMDRHDVMGASSLKEGTHRWQTLIA